MKRIIILIFPVLFLFSCELEDSFPQIESITSGEKWTLQIGSSPIEVYSQLQQLGIEKKFDAVAIVYRKPFSKPEEIRSFLGLYRTITLQSKSGVIERVLIQFNQDKVSSIETGGAMLDDTSSWPQNTSDEIAIHVNDPIDKMYEKLLAIYQIPTYSDYQIILPDKSLEKPFDPDMANYDEWGFTFSYEVKPGRGGISSVRLFFKNGKLSSIRHEYNEADIYD
ncbi:MAG TPA: hypothetical protein VIK10_08345 [Prolixibacteraceae bacterium]